MSHKIIIINRAASGASLAAENDQDAVEYEVAYTPSHDTPLSEQNQRTAKIRRLLARIEATAAGQPDPGD